LPKGLEGWEAFVVGTLYQGIVHGSAAGTSRRGTGLAALALFALSCAASANANLNTRNRMDSEQGPDDAPDFDKPVTKKSLATAEPNFSGEVTLLGARHDMSLVTEHANAACACLKAAIGSSSSAAFAWQAAMPRLNDETQLAFALTSETMACKDEPKGSSGASYWGYRISGNDVVVFVEGARAGRPRTAAAIIPKPVGEGQVYIAPAKAKMPYGRSLDGKSERCKVGNGATKRTTPFTAGELGDTNVATSNVAGVDSGE
jgi:hypothetical protein